MRLSTDQVAEWLLNSNLKEIAQLQFRLAQDGIELHLGLGDLQVVEEEEPKIPRTLQTQKG